MALETATTAGCVTLTGPWFGATMQMVQQWCNVLVAQKETARHFVGSAVAQRDQPVLQLLEVPFRRLVDHQLQVVQEELVVQEQPQ